MFIYFNSTKCQVRDSETTEFKPKYFLLLLKRICPQERLVHILNNRLVRKKKRKKKSLCHRMLSNWHVFDIIARQLRMTSRPAFLVRQFRTNCCYSLRTVLQRLCCRLHCCRCEEERWGEDSNAFIDNPDLSPTKIQVGSTANQFV